MKNKLNLLWLIAVIGLVVMACDNGNQTTAHVHTAGAAATCVTPQTCTTCGEVMQGATGHDFEHDDWDEDEINASCEHPSYDTIACKNAPCTMKDRRTGSHPALGHDLLGAYPATCTAEGYTGIGHCNRCDEDKTGEPLDVDPENHDFGEWAQKTAATCVAPERLIRKCSHNAAHTEEENHGEINLTAHDWNWTLNAIAATCVQMSKDTATCKNTPCTVTNVRDGSNTALGHTGTLAPYAATCTTAGNSAALSGNCVRYAQCGHVVTGTVLPALGHTGTVTAFAATCTTAGNSAALSGNCVRFAQCAHVVTGTVIPALGHDWNWATYTSGIRNCQRGGCSVTVGIGDRGPAGGIIFYVATDGITIQGYGSSGDNGYFAEYTAYYLEAAPANETTSVWQVASDYNYTLIAGVTTFQSIGENNTLTIGVGRKDTQTIVNSAAFASSTNTAAQRCANKTLNGFTDWFLPSLGELNEFYKLKGQAGVPQTGIPTTGVFWSSSQSSITGVWSQSFGDGNQSGFTYTKNNSMNVRAIRAF